jgi:hypothetical protein
VNILKKLFGGPQAADAKRDAVLAKCDLAMARDEIADMHKALQRRAESEGGECYFKTEYVAAWQAFRDRPSIDTARALLVVSPPLLEHFEMCSPGTAFYTTKGILRNRGAQ